ncbi:hypothetical protein BaRGS_00023996 [Batillaria attramentaria]|uniref:F-box domain-containing protein n=1 Tax=Batillaria attramentaria TaxID=370345 RepID=A0ABD0KCA3_9CAEN
MASYTPWLNEHGALVDYTDTARAPAKDFFQLFMTPSEVIYRMWKIVPPTRPENHPAPLEIRDTWEEFKHDERLHSEIQRVAGDRTVHYLMNIIEGHLDYLSRLPHDVLIKIMLMLDLESIAHLSMTCRLFREIGKSNDLWEKLYKIHNKQPITQELLMLVDQKGWHDVFFTNKLQLQMQMRRLGQGDYAFITQQ